MALDVISADAYIEGNVIDIEDWQSADDAKKSRILNVASQVLARKYPTYTIPDNAVYEYCGALAIAFNDTNRLNNQGIAGFSITGVGSFNFKTTQPRTLEAFIPQVALELIGAANGGIKLGKRVVKWTVI
jgi:S-formylglutathione hydrolase FrmB